MSGEVMADVVDAHREARTVIESQLNSFFADRQYGSGLAKLAFISIISSLGSPWFPEIRRYNKRTKTAEFRLAIDHEQFLNASPTKQQALLAQALLRAGQGLKDLNIPAFSQPEFLEDLGAALQRFRAPGSTGERTGTGA